VVEDEQEDAVEDEAPVLEGWKDGRMEGWKDGRMEGSYALNLTLFGACVCVREEPCVLVKRGIRGPKVRSARAPCAV
jgi:hypothetical protein